MVAAHCGANPLVDNVCPQPGVEDEVRQMIDELVESASRAQSEFLSYTQE